MDRKPQATLTRARKPTPLDLTLPSAPRLAYESPDCCIYLDSSAELVQVQSPLHTPPRDLNSSLSSVSLGRTTDVQMPGTPPALPDEFNEDDSSPKLFPRTLDAERVAFHELSQIHSLMKLKSEQISEKERSLQKSSCAVAELMGLATARLQAEAEVMLQNAHRELQRKATAQRRRLDQLLQRTQEEFRKVVACRREVRARRDSAAAGAEEHKKLLQRLQDTQRRCTTLSDREKEQRQTLLEERGKWEKERQRYENQHQQLRQEVQELRQQTRQLSSAIAQTTDSGLRHTPLPTSGGDSLSAKARASEPSPKRENRNVERPTVARRNGHRSSRHKAPERLADQNHSSIWPESESDERSTSVSSQRQRGYMKTRIRNVMHIAPEVTGSPPEDMWLPLMGAWWGLDTLLVTGRRSLWGYVVFLSEALNTCCRSFNPVLRDLAACFIRRWSWRLLGDDARTVLQACSTRVTGASCNKDSDANDVEHNALEWARRHRTCLRSSGSWARRELSQQREVSQMTPEVTPLDLANWLPAADGPLAGLHGYLAPALLPEEKSGRSNSYAGAAGLLVLAPTAAQQRLSATLWHDARQQLLEMEEPMREGDATDGSLAEVGRALLSAAALALGTGVEAASARAALRALVHLCDGHAETLGKVLRDGLPVLLLLISAADHQATAAAAAAVDDESLPNGSAYVEIAEIGANLLAALSRGSDMCRASMLHADAHGELAGLAATALLRMSPASATAEPMAQLLANEVAHAKAAAVPADRLSSFIGLRPQLRQWLERCRSSKGVIASGGAIEHMEKVLETQ